MSKFTAFIVGPKVMANKLINVHGRLAFLEDYSKSFGSTKGLKPSRKISNKKKLILKESRKNQELKNFITT